MPQPPKRRSVRSAFTADAAGPAGPGLGLDPVPAGQTDAKTDSGPGSRPSFRPVPGTESVADRTESKASRRSGRGGKDPAVKPGFWNYPRKQYRGLHRWLPSWRFVGACLLFGILSGVGLFVWAYATIDLPSPNDAAFAQTTRVYYADGQTLMGQFSIQNRQIVDVSGLPEHVGMAVVAAEDRTFWNNAGVDPQALARAFYHNLRGGARQGGSTITQQYIERYFVGNTTTDLFGKFKEAILAVKVTREKDKSEILGDYLNTIYFGRGAYGIETAAQAYYGVSAKDLTVSQAAMIAGVIPAPSAWDPAIQPEKTLSRWNYVLDGMVAIGALTQSERDEQVFPEVIEQKVSDLYAGTQGYLLQMVRHELTTSAQMTEAELDAGGLNIVTTIDRTWQKAAIKAVKNLPNDRPDNLHVAAVSIDPADGGIKALYGGADFISRQYNAVTQDVAQAGSTFKPITLAAALETGEHQLSDWYPGYSPMMIQDWEVANLGDTSYASMSLLRATMLSVNTVYAQLNDEIGGKATAEAAVAAGLPVETLGLTDDLANVLGTASPHPLDMANVYATFAAQGVRHTPHIIDHATNPAGKTVYEGPTKGKRVFSKATAAEVSYALSEVVEGGTGTAALDLGRPCAAKTGTSEEHRSAWFVGYTPQLATAVAFYQEGPDGQVEELTPFGGLEEINGGGLPAQVWVDLMMATHKELPIVALPDRERDQDGANQRREPAQPQPGNQGSGKPAKSPKPSKSTTTKTVSPKTPQPPDKTDSVTPPAEPTVPDQPNTPQPATPKESTPVTQPPAQTELPSPDPTGSASADPPS